MHRSVTLLGLGCFTLFTGCVIVIGKDGGPPPEPTPWVDTGGWGVACDEMAVSSVLVHVVSETGAPMSAQQVTWQAEGMDEEQPADCADDACSTWIAGYEVDGEIRVEATAVLPAERPGCVWEGQTSGSVTVPMTADGCHVITQELTLLLSSADLHLSCDDDDLDEGDEAADSGDC